jgi:uncharacterized membrane protein
MYWGDRWHDHMNGAWGWIGGVMMLLWMLLIIAGTAALIVWLYRSSRPTKRASETPREILDLRFARGEIDVDERESMLSHLGDKPSA